MRDGQGTVLGLTALFIVVKAVMQLAQSRLVSQVSDESRRIALGRACTLAAESAVEEAQVLLASAVNDPVDPLYASLRNVETSTARLEHSWTAGQLPRT